MTVRAEDPANLFVQAATKFAGVVAHIEPAAWSAPALGVWDLRALVGHTSRALITVSTYLDQPAATEAVPSPEEYYALAAGQATGSAAVAERGRQAGHDLGADPAGAVRRLVDGTRAKVFGADPDSLITVLGGGMRLCNYLPTRTFELVVHSFDISAATGIDVTFPPAVLAHVAALASRIAVLQGEGRAVLTALTGRRPLPANFSIVG